MTRHRSSRRRYLSFVEDYKHRRLDDVAGQEKPGRKPRESLRAYLRWLWPHRFGVSLLFVLALLGAGLQMIEPLFMRHIVDRVLLVKGLDLPSRFSRLNVTGAIFFFLIIV